jgi:hypothetical protein
VETRALPAQRGVTSLSVALATQINSVPRGKTNSGGASVIARSRTKFCPMTELLLKQFRYVRNWRLEREG